MWGVMNGKTAQTGIVIKMTQNLKGNDPRQSTGLIGQIGVLIQRCLKGHEKT
jgi:hypothetical protein